MSLKELVKSLSDKDSQTKSLSDIAVLLQDEKTRATTDATEALIKAIRIFRGTRTHSDTSSVNLAQEVNDLHLTKSVESNKSAGSTFSSAEKRSIVIPTYTFDSSSIPLQSECLRVVCNAIADNSHNRFQVLERPEFLIIILQDLIHGNGSVDFSNKELAVLSNLVNDFNPGAKYLAGSELAAQAIMKQLELFITNYQVNLALIIDLLYEILDQENGSNFFPVDFVEVVMRVSSLEMDNINLPEKKFELIRKDGADISAILIKFIETDPRFEEYFARNHQHLTELITLGMKANPIIQDLEKFPDMSRRLLAAIGNISSHPAFQDTVPISKDDVVFNFFAQHLKEKPSHSNLGIIYQGLSLVVFGNLITSTEKVDAFLDEIPDAVEVALNYMSSESDPYALQGAHFIKNVTVGNPDICVKVLKNGGVELIQKLVENSLFANLRLIGVQISKNIFHSYRHKVISPYLTAPIIPVLVKTYKKEDKQIVRNEVIFAFDAALESTRLFSKLDTDEKEKALVQDQSKRRIELINYANVEIGCILIHFMHTIYQGLLTVDKYVVDPLTSIKCSKSLGLLSTFEKFSNPSDSHQEGSPSLILEDVISKHTDNYKMYHEYLVDILGKFSIKLKEVESAELEPHAVSRRASTWTLSPSTTNNSVSSDFPGQAHVHHHSYRGIINNIGFLGSQIRKWKSADEELIQAANTAIRNTL